MTPPALPFDAIPSSFTIVSWNASSLLSRGPAIQLYLHHHRPSILAIIEARVQQTNDIPQHASYNTVHIQHPHQHPHGGLVIYMHKSITCQQHRVTSCTFDSSTASTTAFLHVSSPQLAHPFLLIPAYMSCSASARDWRTLTRFIQRAPTHINPRHTMPTIVIGDLNARDPMWDMTHSQQHSNSAGASLSTFLTSDTADDWHLLNITHQPAGPKPTRFSSVPGVEPSVLDLALCNDPNLVISFDTHTSHPMLRSDHAPISVTLNIIQYQPQTPTRQVWNTSRDNISWDIFQSLLATTLHTWTDKWTPCLSHTATCTQHDIDTSWNELRDIITSVALRVVRKKAVSTQHNHWFLINPALPSLLSRYNRLKRMRQARKRDNIPFSSDLMQQYSQARTAFRQAMRDAKEQCWGELVEQVSQNHHIVWKAWHRTLPSTQHPLPTFTSSNPSDPPPLNATDNLNYIASHFQTISTLPNDPAFNRSEDNNVKHTIDSLRLPSTPVTLPFTKQQLQDQCEHININTALGPDDISPHFLKHGGPALCFHSQVEMSQLC